MTISERTAIVFAASFALIYVFAEQFNWALFTYHPRLGIFEWLTKLSKGPTSGPAMHWFGWIGTATVGATLLTVASQYVPQSRQVPLWVGWAVPLAVMISFLYFMRHFFLT
jgi:hypothetical protein